MNKGFTLVELIAVLLIISIITVMIVPKIIDFEWSAERKLLYALLDEMNAREHMAFLDCKLQRDCSEYEIPDFSDLRGAKLTGNTLKFDGGGSYSIYRNESPYSYIWSTTPGQSEEYSSDETPLPPEEITPPEPDQCPPGYSPDKYGKCKKDKKDKKKK
jgi:prepilin-type N-terminal cleavage/methylation domain-containing protein